MLSKSFQIPRLLLLLRNLPSRFAMLRRRAGQRAALAEMSDRELGDLGVGRSEIPALMQDAPAVEDRWGNRHSGTAKHGGLDATGETAPRMKVRASAKPIRSIASGRRTGHGPVRGGMAGTLTL